MLIEMKVGETINLSENIFITRTEEGWVNERDILVVRADDAMPPIIERELFSPEIHQNIVEFIQSGAFVINNEPSMFKRRNSHNIPFFSYIHQQLAEAASEIFGEKVKPSYVYTSLYGDEGVCPFHTDRPQCKYTIDYCIDQDETWDIWVDDKPYTLQPNDALCYSGTDSPHFREKIKGKYCHLAFFHFVPVDFVGKLD
jgi:hypothetical protein